MKSDIIFFYSTTITICWQFCSRGSSVMVVITLRVGPKGIGFRFSCTYTIFLSTAFQNSYGGSPWPLSLDIFGEGRVSAGTWNWLLPCNNFTLRVPHFRDSVTSHVKVNSSYRFASHNDVSVNDGPHIRRLSHNITILYNNIILQYLPLCYNSLQYSVQ